EEMPDRALKMLARLVSPSSVGYDYFTELGSPVTKLVDLLNIVAHVFPDSGQRMTDYCGPQVGNAERFCDVRRRKVDYNCFAYTLAVFAVVSVLFNHFWQEHRSELALIQSEVDKAIDHINLIKKFIFRDLPGYVACDLHRRFPETLRQAEARKRVV